MCRGSGGTKRVSLLLSNPRDLCQATASHWRDAQPTTVFAAKCVPTSVRRSSLWTVMPCRTHVPHLYRHVVNVGPSIDILHHSCSRTTCCTCGYTITQRESGSIRYVVSNARAPWSTEYKAPCESVAQRSNASVRTRGRPGMDMILTHNTSLHR